MTDISVKAENISKKFKIYGSQLGRVLEWSTLGYYCSHRDFWALKNISFQIKKGECIGIIGPNGAGKSTLLKILSGALWPTLGNFQLNGRVVSLLELGTGFHPELTGIQNIYNSSSLLGFPEKYVREKLDNIINFADIGDFIKQPVKTYSSGMYVRLAFSLFANLEPEIYIVDEALSVGDVFFQQKCYKKLEEMKKEGTSILIVSHDPNPILTFCDHVILIDKGEIVSSGNPQKVWELYQALEYSKVGDKASFKINNLSDDKIDFGDNSVVIKSVKMIDTNNNIRSTFYTGQKARINIEIEGRTQKEYINVGIQIKNRLGNVIYGTNTNWLGLKIRAPKNNEKKCISYEIELNLGVGNYTITAGVVENEKYARLIYNWQECAASFEIVNKNKFEFGGEVYLPVSVTEL